MMKTGGRLQAFSHTESFFTPFSHRNSSIGKLLMHCNGTRGISNRDPYGYFLSLAALATMAGLCEVDVPKTHSTQAVRSKRRAKKAVKA